MKEQHKWESRSIDPVLNGNKDGARYFDLWTEFRQCSTCNRVEEIDRDAMCTDELGEDYELQGWFVVSEGDTTKCEQVISPAYHVYVSYVNDNRTEKKVALEDTTSKHYGPEVAADLVTDEVIKSYYEEMHKKLTQGDK